VTYPTHTWIFKEEEERLLETAGFLYHAFPKFLNFTLHSISSLWAREWENYKACNVDTHILGVGGSVFKSNCTMSYLFLV
jgi:hypothetical protein